MSGASPRCRASSSSSDRYESANDEEGDGDETCGSSHEILPRSSPSPSLPARILSLKGRGKLFQNPNLSPDRTSHDGFEVERPSMTPNSRLLLCPSFHVFEDRCTAEIPVYYLTNNPSIVCVHNVLAAGKAFISALPGCSLTHLAVLP